MNPPNTHSWRISSKTAEALKKLIGELAVSVYAPILEVSVYKPHYYVSNGFSVSTRNGAFINIYCGDWLESNTFWMNYFEFIVTETVEPRNLEAQYDILSNTMKAPFGWIKFHGPVTPIRTVQIFEEIQQEQDDVNQEIVTSDSLFLFTRESGEQFVIYIENASIAGNVILVADALTIQEFISSGNYRIVQEI